MSSFILSCMFAFALTPGNFGLVDKARPQAVCEAIEFFSEAQDVDPYVIAAIAWHESTWSPRLVSLDREDYGPMQVRVRQATGNRWVRGLGGQVCTREWVRSVWGGVECGVWVFTYWRDQLPRLHKDRRWPRRSVLGCYAMGQACIHNHAARDIEKMAGQLRRLAEFAESPWQSAELEVWSR